MPKATTTTAASGGNREELLGQRPARRACRPRHDADAGCRNPLAAGILNRFCSKQKPQNKTPPERCTKHSSEGGFSSKSRFHFCLSLKACNGGAPHGDTSRRGSRRVLSGRTLRGSLQTGFQPVACSLCADGMRRYSARINAFILLPLYYSGAAQGSQGGTKTIQNARR